MRRILKAGARGLLLIGVAVALAVLVLPGGGARPAAAQPAVPGVAELDATSNCDGTAPGMADPAAVYCRDLGYEYQVVDAAQGQYGVCAFPDDGTCDAWRFLEGKCGQSHSYCARQGYGLITKTDGRNPFSKEYSVCVSDHQEIGAATDMMGLSEKAGKGAAPARQGPTSVEEGPSTQSPPSSFDWRNSSGQDWMTSVKDQGTCGSCWAFSAVGVVEPVHNIASGNPSLDLDLSEEYLVSDCLPNNTCCGGMPEAALTYIRKYGIPDEACLQYVSGTDCTCPSDVCSSATCTYSNGGMCGDAACSDRCADWAARLTRIGGIGYVAGAAMKDRLVEKGPLSAAMGVGTQYGGYFDGDIYRCTDDSGVNHAVVIAGYDDGGGYWIVKNSWGSSWNGDGYFKVGYGECAIESDVYWASVAVSVGGIADLPPTTGAGADASAAPADGSGWSAGAYAVLAGGLAAAFVAFGGGAWYARRRWLR